MAPDVIRDISLATLSGTVELLQEKHLDYDTLINRVATPGGITEEGVKIIDRTVPSVFDEVFRATLAKRAKIRAEMRRQYGLS
jgi:pyrroline-5-carboxylate reductase